MKERIKQLSRETGVNYKILKNILKAERNKIFTLEQEKIIREVKRIKNER